MKLYVFGNPDFEPDTVALEVAKKLEGKISGLKFVFVNPNEDLPFAGGNEVIIMDAIEGIEKITLIGEKDFHKIKPMKSVSVHDFDLGFQLGYLKKIGKIEKVTIIGLPMNKKINYLRIQSILRKLVAQDMQGS